MLRNILVLLTVLLVILSGCQYFTPRDEGKLLTGEVIEILPGEDNIITEINDELVNIDELEDEVDELDLEDYSWVVEGVEGETIKLSPDAYDPDGDPLTFTFSEPFNDEGEWDTEEGDAGEYVITVTASDGRLSTSEEALVIVKPTNKAPVIECEDEQEFMEGELVQLACNIYDPEGKEVDFEYSGWMETDEKQTGYEDAGTHYVFINATDGKKESSKTIEITIVNKNRAPEVEDIEPIIVEETDIVSLDVVASDPDGDELTITYSEPFDEEGVWRTEFGDTGTFESSVTVTDGVATVIKHFTVTVKQKNTMPSLEFIPDIEVNEGETITLEINAFDREGDNLTINISGWMTTDTYTTTYDDAGEYTVTVTVSDGELEMSQDVGITVNDVNRPPVFNFG